jgi:hypothetical protein
MSYTQQPVILVSVAFCFHLLTFLSNEISGLPAMHRKVLFVLLMLSSGLLAQTALPSGSILPVRVDSSLSSKKARKGQQIKATVMQNIPNTAIRRGTKVLGQVVAVTDGNDGHPAELSFRFDTLVSKRSFHINTGLQALASSMDVSDAQVPKTGADRGTPWAWATRHLIGGDVAYGQGGDVKHGGDIVGKVLEDGVLVRVQPNPARGCRNEDAENIQPQATWIFSSDACGVYGFSDLSIAHTGRSVPLGEVKLVDKVSINIRSGSGMLLRINSGQ